jgi:hypothetical protein
MRNHALSRLKAAIHRSSCFTDTEIDNAFRMCRTFRGASDLHHYGAEAVVCYGGPAAVINHAVRFRNRSRHHE